MYRRMSPTREYLRRELVEWVNQQQRRAVSEILQAGALIAAGLALILFSAIYTPAVEYTPRLEITTAGPAGVTPEQRIARFLLRWGYLPAEGTQMTLDSATNRLEWRSAADVPSSQPIQRLTVDHVRVASSAPLLWSVLSRSPITTAEVAVSAQTGDGQWHHLTFVLWQYRLLLPWPANTTEAVTGIWLPLRVDWRS